MGAPVRTEASGDRLHGLDALRAVMMLLGLALHAMVSYGPLRSLGEMWPYLDANTSVICDLAIVSIHAFRIPVFFVMAGYFSSMLYERRGALGLMSNRLSRIGLPFIVGLLVVYPITRAGFVFATSTTQVGIAGAWSSVPPAMHSPYAQANTIRPWFLYYLLYFYVAALLCARLVEMLPATVQARGRAVFERITGSRWRVVLLAGLTALTLLPMRTASFDTSATFMPEFPTLSAYFVFFGFGWLLYGSRGLLKTFSRFAWTQCAVATVLFLPNFLALRAVWSGAPYGAFARVVAAVSGGLIVWLLVFGLLGLFLRHFERPSAKIRYLVDASYWLYLLHLPLAIWLPGLMSEWNAPALLKVAIVLGVMAPTLLGSYHLFVRSTAIGAVLNGRRYPAPIPFFRPRPRS
ncbi:MAG: acyltransferase family protein [Nannocystaceae bacterium]|nr:acyltransferase family protein [Nannocystaceae bacterium]